jgi:hypothetical protein
VSISPGARGGGFGPLWERDLERVGRDIIEGGSLLSALGVSIYGVAIDGEIDAALTHELRATLACRRGFNLVRSERSAGSEVEASKRRPPSYGS